MQVGIFFKNNKHTPESKANVSKMKDTPKPPIRWNNTEARRLENAMHVICPLFIIAETVPAMVGTGSNVACAEAGAMSP